MKAALSSTDTVVVVGGSIAGLTAVRALREQGFGGRITVFDRDPDAPYRRPEVSKSFLTRPPGPNSMALAPELDVEVRVEKVREIDVDAARLVSDTGSTPFDGLVVATGSRARSVAAWAGAGTHSLRTARDAARLRRSLERAGRVVVVGGGFIGLEVAAKAAAHKTVHVIEAADEVLDRVAHPRFGHHVRRLLEARGVRFHLGNRVETLGGLGDGSVEVRLADDTGICGDVVVSAVGSAPDTGWLVTSGLDVSDGVRCDETCAVTGTERIVAAGDVANWYNPVFSTRMRVEHWTNALEQGTYAAARLLHRHDPSGFGSVPYFWSTQAQHRVECMGTTRDHDEYRVLAHEDDRILAAYGRGGTLVAVAGVGATRAVMRAKDLVRRGCDLDDPGVQALAE